MRRTYDDRSWVAIYNGRIQALTAERDEARASVGELEALLTRLTSIEGPQPGDVQWFKDVQATLSRVCVHDWVEVDAYPFREAKCAKCGASMTPSNRGGEHGN